MTHRFGSEKLPTKSHDMKNIPSSKFLAIPKGDTSNNPNSWVTWWAFLGWNEMDNINNCNNCFCSTYYNNINMYVGCVSFLEFSGAFYNMNNIFKNKLQQKQTTRAMTTATTLWCYNLFNSQQDWLLVRRNSWNCPCTLCQTTRTTSSSTTSAMFICGIFTNLNYPLFLFQCFYGRIPTILVWSLRPMWNVWKPTWVQKQCKVWRRQNVWLFEIMGVSKNRWILPPNHPIFNRVFHDLLTIHFGDTPYIFGGKLPIY